MKTVAIMANSGPVLALCPVRKLRHESQDVDSKSSNQARMLALLTTIHLVFYLIQSSKQRMR